VFQVKLPSFYISSGGDPINIYKLQVDWSMDWTKISQRSIPFCCL